MPHDNDADQGTDLTLISATQSDLHRKALEDEEENRSLTRATQSNVHQKALEENLHSLSITPSGSYQYTPLDPNCHQIRVLSILPRANYAEDPDEDVLRCTLKVVDLDDYSDRYRWFLDKVKTTYKQLKTPTERLDFWQWVNWSNEQSVDQDGELFNQIDECEGPVYERFSWGDYLALSYVWGDPTNRRNILLDGYEFSITTNLYQALLHLRELYDGKLRVWADAICINQADLVERTREVKKMAQIYSDSYQVHSWLGQPDPAVAEGLLLTKAIVLSFTGLNFFEVDVLKEHDAASIHAVMMAVTSLFSNPYWERVWILQEMKLSPSLSFGYGDVLFTPTELTQCIGMSYSKILRLPNLTGFSYNNYPVATIPSVMYRLTNLRRDNNVLDRLGRHPRSSDMIQIAQLSKATDERDKVYGLLGLLPAPIASVITPSISYDASNTFQSVFTLFSRAFFQSENSLSFLARNDRGQAGIPDDLFSWVCDLRYREASSQSWLSFKQEETSFAANQDLPEAEFEFSPDGSLLICKGSIIDTAWSGVNDTSEDATEMFVRLMNLGLNQSYLLHLGGKGTSPNPYADWRLALARVLTQQSEYNFSDGVSILDIPWSKEDISEPHVDPFKPIAVGSVLWLEFLQHSGIGEIFKKYLHPNGDVDVGGRPLRSYFTSTETICPYAEPFLKMLGKLGQALSSRQLFQTLAGLFGTGPCGMIKGDVVAVLSNCDMPLVLRPKGEHFQVIGGCFVEGLMRGEVGQHIEQGHLQIRELTIC